MILAIPLDFQIAQFWIDLGSVLLTVILAVPTLLPKGRAKRLSYRILSDAALIDERKDLGEDDIQVKIDGNEVTNVRLIMMQLMNSGSQPIKNDEYEYENEAKIHFEFKSKQPKGTKQSKKASQLAQPPESSQPTQPPQSPLILCAIHATKPDGIMSKSHRQKQLILGRSDTSNSPLYDHVDLMGTLLNPGDYINLKFLTQGKVDIVPRGRLVGGSVQPYAPPPPLVTPWRIALIIIIVATVAAFNLGLGPIQNFVQNNCALSFSNVVDGGSTAFYKTAQTEASKYHSTCLLGSIAVTSSGSGPGLRSLESNDLQIANSELSLKEAGYNYNDLQEHQVAVIVFTLIVNKYLSGITSLNRDQITGIYNGTITNWQSVGGPDLPIKVIGRPNDSGTHAAFTRFVLNQSVQHSNQSKGPVLDVESSTAGVIDTVRSNLGAIGYVDLASANQASNAVNALVIDGHAATLGLVENDSYRFWAIERMYTKKNADSLSLAFIEYVKRDIQTNATFIRIGDVPKSVLDAHA
jgi:phosphate transport system substrate-binding protein